MIFMSIFTVRVKQTEVVQEVSRNHPSRKMANKLFIGQYVFCLLSLILKVTTMLILLFYVLGYIRDDEKHMAFRCGKTLYNMSWSYLYLAYNCILYQWVFSVHRVNLYGDEIDVATFKQR